MDVEKVHATLNSYKDLIMVDKNEVLDDYGLGFLHGLEFALSLLEERPAMYPDNSKEYSKTDMERHPEYFL